MDVSALLSRPLDAQFTAPDGAAALEALSLVAGADVNAHEEKVGWAPTRRPTPVLEHRAERMTDEKRRDKMRGEDDDRWVFGLFLIY